jgi:hypothetical protein
MPHLNKVNLQYSKNHFCVECLPTQGEGGRQAGWGGINAQSSKSRAFMLVVA